MLIFCGCASEVQFYPMSPGYAGEPVPLEDVQLFITQKPPYKYKELGMVTYNTSGGYIPEVKGKGCPNWSQRSYYNEFAVCGSKFPLLFCGYVRKFSGDF